MSDIPWESPATWAGVAGLALAIFGYWLVRRHRRRGELVGEYRNRLKDVCLAEKAYQKAVRDGTAAEARQAAQILDAMRKAADALAGKIKALSCFVMALGVAVLSGGCITREGPERIVQLDEHIRIVQPGETVPDFASGESRWWLVSPTGLMELMPKYRQEEF